MKIKNAIILLQFNDAPYTCRNKQRTRKRLFVYLAHNSKNDELSLINSEINEDETFEDNTRKEIWNKLHVENLCVLKGEYYDSFEDKFGERTVHCSSMCILDEQVTTSNSWYEIELSPTCLTLKNGNNEYVIKFEHTNAHTRIISSDILLAECGTTILIDALLKLKDKFYFSPISLQYVEDTFAIANLVEILNCFSTKTLSKATIKRRLSNYIKEQSNAEDDKQPLYTKINKNRQYCAATQRSF